MLPEPRPLGGFKSAALFLDLDGTLAAIRPRPEDVGPEPWRTSLLIRLGERLGGRLAVISGRSLEEVDRILEGAVVAVAAVHGLVRRRPDGVVEETEPSPGLIEARRRIDAFCTQHPGVHVEDKGLSLAIHFRQAPELGPEVRREAEAISAEAGLSLQLGDMVAELCTPGLDKGAAVKAFMRERPFDGAVPVFVGDDLTDENGFRAVRHLGGVSILVGPARPTDADMRLHDVPAVRAWLEAALMQDAHN
ncbi:MAG TPA: trehalose-phosphatase [Caulobacteraceae bacterium]|nr:trehalose-phosphatase [Caulobacteraceae bacterium]